MACNRKPRARTATQLDSALGIMNTANDAEALVQEHLDEIYASSYDPDRVKLVVAAGESDEREWGWIVFYGAENPEDIIAGNAPYFVNRETADLWISGTAFPLEHYVREYEKELNVQRNNA